MKLLLSTISFYSFTKKEVKTLTFSIFFSNVFVLLFSEVIARMKPGVDGGVFTAIEVGGNVRTF